MFYPPAGRAICQKAGFRAGVGARPAREFLNKTLRDVQVEESPSQRALNVLI